MIFRGTTEVYERNHRKYSPRLIFESFVLFQTERTKILVESLVLSEEMVLSIPLMTLTIH